MRIECLECRCHEGTGAEILCVCGCDCCFTSAEAISKVPPSSPFGAGKSVKEEAEMIFA